MTSFPHMMVIWHAAAIAMPPSCSCLPHPTLTITLFSAAAVVAMSQPLPGCAFRFLFWSRPGLIFRNHLVSSVNFGFRIIYFGITSFQGKINLFWNPPKSGIPAGILGGKVPFYATCNKDLACRLIQHKNQVSTMAFCFLVLPCPTASRYTAVLPALLSMLEQS